MRFAVLLLLCLGCANAPTAYNQAALPLPPVEAPAFNPAEDAPHVFEPDAPRPTMQPQPKPTRVLPETPETRRGPGLWASEAPRAAVGPDMLEFDDDIRLRLPHEESYGDHGNALKCAKFVHFAVGRMGYPYADWAQGLRRCIYLRMWRFCMDSDYDTRGHINAASRLTAVDMWKQHGKGCGAATGDEATSTVDLFKRWRAERPDGEVPR